jgi:hypothetical protein
VCAHCVCVCVCVCVCMCARVGSIGILWKCCERASRQPRARNRQHSTVTRGAQVASTVARDLASMTIAPSPVKKVAADDEWATVPVKSKKKSSKA